jgi:hypothetical protein
MINSCLSAFKGERSRGPVDPWAFVESYLETRRRSQSMRHTFNRMFTFAAVGLVIAVLASFAVISTRVFLLGRDEEAQLEPPAEVVPEVV